MIEVHVSREVEAPASKVWAILQDFGNISWAPGIERVEVIGEGIGMTRRIFMPGMEPIDEQLTAMMPDQMQFSYVIPNGLPMPVDDYHATGQVTALQDGRCRLDWRGGGVPQAGVSEEQARDAVAGVYGMLLQWIDERATD